MAKGLEKEYYKLSEKEFADLLDRIRTDPDTLHFFRNSSKPFFFLEDRNIRTMLLALHKDQWDFDHAMAQFTDFGKKQLIQSMLINEIQSTNSIENVFSTKHDIFYLINNGMKGENRKIISIANAYSILLKRQYREAVSLQAVREIYDQLMAHALEKDDYPDGEYFRKKPVYISDGMQNVHQGFYPEAAINEGMQEFLELYNDQNTDVLERLILSHFLIETIHPFYDGNGRLGRFLFTMKYYYETGSCIAFGTASAINKNKAKYYKAFSQANNPHMYGSLNAYVEDFCSILHKENQLILREMNEKIEQIKKLDFSGRDYTPAEQKILHLLGEAALLSDFGVSNSEIMNCLSLSKRTVIYAINKFRKMHLLMDTKIGKTTYHQLKDMSHSQKHN